MGIFSSKPKKTMFDMESFCVAYYDFQMFHKIENGKDNSQKKLDAAFKLLADSDPHFIEVDRALFESEMTAMHLELFSLAFFQRFTAFENSVQQGIFTQNYLQDKGRSDIWLSMLKYSASIFLANIMALGHTYGDSFYNEVNNIKDEVAREWIGTHFSDPNNLTIKEEEIVSCVYHVCNYIKADILQEEKLVLRVIGSCFLSRLSMKDIWGENYNPNEDFYFRLSSLIYSMYELPTAVLKITDLRFP